VCLVLIKASNSRSVEEHKAHDPARRVVAQISNLAGPHPNPLPKGEGINEEFLSEDNQDRILGYFGEIWFVLY
jgi:hypothetical protein